MLSTSVVIYVKASPTRQSLVVQLRYVAIGEVCSRGLGVTNADDQQYIILYKYEYVFMT